jgi:UDP-N-acetylmuramyl pentapeptide synthase
VHWLLHIIGADNVSGTLYGFWSGFGSDIGEIALVGSIAEVGRRAARHHRERTAQAARHHSSVLEQAAAHHKSLRDQAERHHQQRLDQADAQHEALKAHLAAQQPATRKPAAKSTP